MGNPNFVKKVVFPIGGILPAASVLPVQRFTFSASAFALALLGIIFLWSRPSSRPAVVAGFIIGPADSLARSRRSLAAVRTRRLLSRHLGSLPNSSA